MSSVGRAALLALLASSSRPCSAAADDLFSLVEEDTCPTPHVGGAPVARESVLMQVMRSDSVKVKSKERTHGVTSDCAPKLNAWGKSNAACLVVQGEKALLVKVPYGSNRGWDFPGGYRHSGEYACQTAERETCEESGHQVRAVEQISGVVFRCEMVKADVCRKAVDEGFLEKRWYGKDELRSIHYRGGTWGDKEAMLRRALEEAEAEAKAAAEEEAPAREAPMAPAVTEAPANSQADCFEADTDYWGYDLPGNPRRDAQSAAECQAECSQHSECAVFTFVGSSYPGYLRNTCWLKSGSGGKISKAGLISGPRSCRAALTSPAALVDVVGCNACDNEGFSSSSQRCASGSESDPSESCAALRKKGGAGARVDSCGCKSCDGEGWSSSRGSCAQGSTTEPTEACACLKRTSMLEK